MEILNKILGKNSISSLQTKSSNIFNIFNETVTKLSEVNKEIETEVKTRKDQIVNLNNEVSQLDGIASGNANMIAKIEHFLKP